MLNVLVIARTCRRLEGPPRVHRELVHEHLPAHLPLVAREVVLLTTRSRIVLGGRVLALMAVKRELATFPCLIQGPLKIKKQGGGEL